MCRSFRSLSRRPRQLGKALSILAAAERAEAELHADVDAWGAPGECHKLVARGAARRRRLARRQAEAVAGMPLRALLAEARRRTSPAAVDRAMVRASASRHPWF